MDDWQIRDTKLTFVQQKTIFFQQPVILFFPNLFPEWQKKTDISLRKQKSRIFIFLLIILDFPAIY